MHALVQMNAVGCWCVPVRLSVLACSSGMPPFVLASIWLLSNRMRGCAGNRNVLPIALLPHCAAVVFGCTICCCTTLLRIYSSITTRFRWGHHIDYRASLTSRKNGILFLPLLAANVKMVAFLRYFLHTACLRAITPSIKTTHQPFSVWLRHCAVIIFFIAQ